MARAEAPHPPAEPPVSEQPPAAWWSALQTAARNLELHDVAALNVDGQGHGLVVLDAEYEVIRPAKLWSDTTSADEAQELVDRLGPDEWVRRTGIVPLSAITISKLLWLKGREPVAFARVTKVLVPPDYLTWRLTGAFVTDRSAAAGTGYMNVDTSEWDLELLALVDADRDWSTMLPRIAGPVEAAGRVTEMASGATGFPTGALVGPGANDQPVSALALGIVGADAIVSLGTSGTVSVRTSSPVMDPTGAVTCVADAAGAYRPLVCTLNATKVTDAFGQLLDVDYDELAELALSAPSEDAERPILVPYLDGERTPNRPDASGVLSGLRPGTSRAQVARAAFEGVLLGLLEGLDALHASGVPTGGRIVLTGGGAASPAYRQLLADLSGEPVYVSDLDETSAAGAAVQAAAMIQGRSVDEVTAAWAPELRRVAIPRLDQAVDHVRARYRHLVALEGLDG